jgi:hypothetical protein
MFDQAFFQNFMSNLLATCIGVIIGIPIALWIARRGTDAEDKKKKHVENIALRSMLSLVKSELEHNKGRIEYLQEQSLDLISALELSLRLRDNSWMSFSQALRLQLIDHPEILNSISVAYGGVNELKYLGHLYFSSEEIVRQRNSLEFSSFFAGFRVGGLSKADEEVGKAIEAIRIFLEEES